MVTEATLKRKSINELENIRAYNESKVKELLWEIDVIDSILAEKSQDEVVKDGYYLVDGTQSILAEVVDGKIYQVYDANQDFHINRKIAVRFEKGDMVCQLKGKKRKLTFMIAKNSEFNITNGTAYILVRSNNKEYIEKIANKFKAFLNYQTENKEINETKEVFNQALAVLNSELNENYTFDHDSLFKFLDLKFVKNLINHHNISVKIIGKVLTLIYFITFLNQKVFVHSFITLEENLKRYELSNNKRDYKKLLKDIVKMPKVNL